MANRDEICLNRWAVYGDAQAFSELVRRYGGMVYGTCLRVLGNPADAEDVTQDCFLALTRRPPQVERSLGGWLHSLATSRSLDRIRGDRRRAERERRFSEETAATVSPEWNDIQPHVDEAIAALPPNLREPLVRHYLLQESQQAIAKDLGVSRPAVSQRILRGIQLVRNRLARSGVVVGGAAPILSFELPGGVPSSLATALGKIAVAGPASSGVPIAAAGTAVFMTKKAVAVVVVAVVSLTAVVANRTAWPPKPSAPVTIVEDDDEVELEVEPAIEGEAPPAPAPLEIPRESDPLSRIDESSVLESDEFEKALASMLKSMYRNTQEAELTQPSSSMIPPDNGAHYFLLAWELFDRESASKLSELWTELGLEGWRNLEIQEIIRNSQDVFAAIRQGLAVGNVRLPDSKDGPLTQLPYLSPFRQIARLMAMEARLFEYQGDYAAALDNYTTIIAFGNESPVNGSIINGLVGYAINAIGTDNLFGAVQSGNLSASDYERLAAQLVELEQGIHSHEEMQIGEGNVMDLWFSERLGDPDAIRDALTTFRDDFTPETLALFNSLDDDEFEALYAGFLEDRERVITLASHPFPELAAMPPDQYFSDNALSQAIMPSFLRIATAESRVQTQIRGLTIMAGLENYWTEHGVYPDTLDALQPDLPAGILVDPFSNQPFQYHSDGSSYFVHSVGLPERGPWGVPFVWNSAEGGYVPQN